MHEACGANEMPLYTVKQACTFKYINPFMPYAAMHLMGSLFAVPEDETGMAFLVH